MNQTLRSPFRSSLGVLLAGIGIIVALVLAHLFRYIILATLIGIGGSVILAPALRALNRHTRIPRGVVALLVLLVMASVCGSIAYLTYVTVAGQTSRLIEQAPEILDALYLKFQSWSLRFPWIGDVQQDFDPTGTLQHIGEALLGALRTSATFFTSLAIALLVAMYAAVNASTYFNGFLTLFPAHRRPALRRYGLESARVLRRWFLSQLVVTCISGLLTALALWIIGLEYWILFGVITAVLGLIPYLGAIITGAAVCLVTLGAEPEKFWLVLAIFVVIQQLESDITLPLVMKNGVRLPEAHLLVFMFIMGSAFGLAGVFIAAPLLAVLHHLYELAYVPWTDRMDGRALHSLP